jgi:hypothetical protein
LEEGTGNSINKVKNIIPENYVEKFENLTPKQKYNIKRKYKNTAVIYLWLNKLNGKCYIGSTINLSSRLANYFDSYYLNNTKEKMAIFSPFGASAALLQYGYTNFNLYILETFPELINSKAPQGLNPEVFYGRLRATGL